MGQAQSVAGGLDKAHTFIAPPHPGTPQPLDRIEWLPREAIKPNDYNPNEQPPAEFMLLKVSILQDGWTQPIVIHDLCDGTKPEIVDGEHRWQASGDPDIARLTGGMVPVVRIKGDLSHRMMSTIRHNRARGEHGVLAMAGIVRKLLADGNDVGDICLKLGMEDEEVERLAERAGMPVKVAAVNPQFSKGWVPGDDPNS